ncbi:Wzz/FepE/Etk N-terminal domain-containing protein [Saccharicrinis aurantiacus]|uniref:Wzz/FepE/Etk N-terminal domain-containing protein n=1 Tax=Saccharicrinis aurantiacus TaxID=1849719 RepID=UPI0008388CA8|nr:Wzz/FepE/Etk N-terminal domain-containing protein [Saccharicrinis aurantiacus]
MDNNIEKAQIEDDEIDLIAIAKTIWEGREIIIKSTIICTIIGLFIAIFSPKEYTATTTFIPQVSDGKSMGGSLGGLAAMAGINLGSMGSNADISPNLYPQIIASTDFCKEIMQMELTISDIDHPVTFYDYFIEEQSPSIIGSIKQYTIGLPRLIISGIKSISKDEEDTTEETNYNDIAVLTAEEYGLQLMIPAIITATVDDKEGVVTLSSVMHEALAAAQVTHKAQELLQKYVTLYKVEKAKKECQFIRERYNEHKIDFEKAQNILAEYSDQNKNITSAKAKSEYERLSSAYQLKFNIYNELAKQFEQAKLKVSEDTPSFSMIQEVVVPMEKSAPRRSLILVIWCFLGGFIGLSTIIGRQVLAKIKVSWTANDEVKS